MDGIIYWALTLIAALGAASFTAFNIRNWIGKGKYLCEDCRFNSATACLKLERPTAINCVSYRPLGEPVRK